MMIKFKGIIFATMILGLNACTRHIIEPNTLNKSGVIYVERGGFQMRQAIKDVLKERGYNMTVGTKKASKTTASDDSESISMDPSTNVFKARYVVEVKEDNRSWASFIDPLVCFFGGMEWWRFNVSIGDNETGKEILSWYGKGCALFVTSKFENFLDRLEIKDE